MEQVGIRFGKYYVSYWDHGDVGNEHDGWIIYNNIEEAKQRLFEHYCLQRYDRDSEKKYSIEIDEAIDGIIEMSTKY